jgi:hypothetical protein
MHLRTIGYLPLLAAGALALAACDTGMVAPGAQATGKAAFTVRLTDAPGDLAEAWVKVLKVQLIGGDSTAADTLTEPVDLPVEASDWIDLLALADGNATTLLSDSVPAGRYAQVRLVVCEMYITTTDGQHIATPDAVLPDGVSAAPGSELKLTSQCQSGFKVVMRGDALRLGADSASTLSIDFDARHSFAHQAGKSGKWVVTPVLFGTLGKDGASGAGSVEGHVLLDPAITAPVDCGGASLSEAALLAGFVPTATSGDTVHAGTATSTGTYRLGNLPPGGYTLGNEPIGFENGDTLRYTAAATPGSVTVVADSASTADYAVSAVACQTP